MQSEPNPNPAPEQARNGARIIENLKAAGEELKMSPPLSQRSVGAELPKKISSRPVLEKVDLVKKIEEYQKELNQELSILEKKHQGVQALEKKLRERIELLKKLQVKSLEINKELKEFEEQMALVKHEQ